VCQRFIQCCTAPNAPPCPSFAYDENSCKANYVAMGYDCATSQYASKMVCQPETDACINDIPLVACTDIEGGTANWPASCNTFWMQYQ
jgi:hypothetical protein